MTKEARFTDKKNRKVKWKVKWDEENGWAVYRKWAIEAFERLKKSSKETVNYYPGCQTISLKEEINGRARKGNSLKAKK